MINYPQSPPKKKKPCTRERRMSNYVTNYLQRSTSTMTQVDMCRRQFQYYFIPWLVQEADNIDITER